MTLTMRRYRDDEDYWRIRAFLRETFELHGRRERNWQAYRFDYWRWHGTLNMGDGSLEEDVFLWETAAGELAAIVHPEPRGHAVLQVHPAHRTPELEEGMLAVAERHLPRPGKDGRPRLRVWAAGDDDARKALLAHHGFAAAEAPEYQRRRSLDEPIDPLPIAEGYQVRALGGPEEQPARSHASWKAFHPTESEENYKGWHWYRNIQRAPLYRRDLDLVAVAPSGEIASFGTIWFDDVTRTGAFEPVGTHPDHQRRGLAQAVMTEGLCRLQSMGATLAFVGSYSPAAHALYASVGFTEYDISEPWDRFYA